MVYRTTERGMAVREAAKARLLQAAGRLFAKKGFDATTMQDIVREADTSIGNAYFYFDNKEALARTLMEASSAAMFDAAEAATNHLPDGPERIGAIIAVNTTTFLETRRELVVTLASDSRLGIIQVMGDVAVERWLPVLAAAFPERDPAELPLIASAIWGADRAIVEHIARGRIDVPTRIAVAFMVRWALRALGLSSTRIDRIVTSSWRLASRHVRQEANSSW
jgi:AcrR family transcriptional regulator